MSTSSMMDLGKEVMPSAQHRDKVEAKHYLGEGAIIREGCLPRQGGVRVTGNKR